MDRDPRTDRDVERVLEAVATAEPRCGAVTVVAVDGPSGSGKTTLALAVARALGCPLVHMDDLYPGWDGLRQAVSLVTEWVLRPLARGERAAYPVWDWGRDEWGPTVVLPRTDLLVLEGCGSSVGSAGGYAAVRVWVEADAACRLRRGLDRDGEAYRPHWLRWARQEQALFAADGTRTRADVVIDTNPDPAGC